MAPWKVHRLRETWTCPACGVETPLFRILKDGEEATGVWEFVYNDSAGPTLTENLEVFFELSEKKTHYVPYYLCPHCSAKTIFPLTNTDGIPCP